MNSLSRRLVGIAAIGGIGTAIASSPAIAAPNLPPGGTWQNVVACAPSLSELVQMTVPDGHVVALTSYFPDQEYSATARQHGTIGAGLMIWRASVPRSAHNGGTIISPSVPGAGQPNLLAPYLRGEADPQANATGCWVRDSRSAIDPTWFGARMDAPVDNSVALAASVSAAVAQKVRDIRIPAGTLQYSASPNFGYSHLRVTGAGRSNTVLKYTGNDKAFIVDPSPFGRQFIHGFTLQDLTIEGNANTKVLVYTDQSARMSMADLGLREANPASGIALDLHASVLGRFESIVCSINEQPIASRPNKIIVLDRAIARSEHMQCSTNTFVDVIVEGATGIGIHLVASDQAMFVGGTSEANLGGTGVVIEPVCRYNSFIGMGCEANALGDFVNHGISTQFVNCYSGTSIELRSASRHATIDGGLYRQITVAPGAQRSTVRGLTYNYFAAGGGFTDHGDRTSADSLIDARLPKLPGDPSPWGGQYVSTTPAPVTVAPESSPHTIRNTTARTSSVTIAGAGVETVTLHRRDSSTVLGGSAAGLPTSGPYLVSPDDTLSISYTGDAPTILVVPSSI